MNELDLSNSTLLSAHAPVCSGPFEPRISKGGFQYCLSTIAVFKALSCPLAREDMGTHELLIIGPLTFLVGSRIHWKVFNFGE